MKINGRDETVKATPGTYLTLARTWRDERHDRAPDAVRLLSGSGSGLHIVPVAPYLSPDEVQYILTDSGSKAVIASPAAGIDLLDVALEQCPVRLVVNEGGTSHDDDFAAALAAESDAPTEFVQGTMMRYSSGTTGRPKGIVMRDAPTKAGASRDF